MLSGNCGTKVMFGAGEMAWRLQKLAALVTDSIASTHMSAHNFLQLQFQGNECSLLPPCGQGTNMWTRCTGMHVGKTPAYI